MASKKGNTLNKVEKQVEYFHQFTTEKLLNMRNHNFKTSKEKAHWKMALNQVLKERGIDIKNL
jgi:hypothetical protein